MQKKTQDRDPRTEHPETGKQEQNDWMCKTGTDLEHPWYKKWQTQSIIEQNRNDDTTSEEMLSITKTEPQQTTGKHLSPLQKKKEPKLNQKKLEPKNHSMTQNVMFSLLLPYLTLSSLLTHHLLILFTQQLLIHDYRLQTLFFLTHLFIPLCYKLCIHKYINQ